MNSCNLFEITHSLLRQFGPENWTLYKRKQVLAFIQRPVFRTELAQQRMRDLKQVAAVHRGIQTLVALVIRAGVQLSLIHI